MVASILAAFKLIPNLAETIGKAVRGRQQVQTQRITSVADVLIEDAKGESWMQRTWRPFLGYSLAAILVVELLAVRVTNIILALRGSDIRIDYRELPPEFWVLIISVATVFGGARTWRHLRRSKQAAVSQKRKGIRRRKQRDD